MDELRDYVDLTDVALRMRSEIVGGLFIAEGEKVIRRAMEAGYRPRSFLSTEKWLPGIEALRRRFAAENVPVHVRSAEQLRELTGYEVHRGALASMHRGDVRDPVALLRQSHRIVVLEDLVDATNLGAVFRGAAALGIDAVLLTPRCADPLYRRAVKTSMGAVFSMPYARFEKWPECFQTLQEAGFVRFAATPDPTAVDVASVVFPQRSALMFGSEGPGLSGEALRSADVHVRIPMDAGVDSLNVAAAAAVFFFALRVQRSPDQL